MNAKNPSLLFSLWSRFCLFLESCKVKMEHDVCRITRIYHENKTFPEQKANWMHSVFETLLYEKLLATVWHQVIWNDVKSECRSHSECWPFPSLLLTNTSALNYSENSRNEIQPQSFSDRSHSIYTEQLFYSLSRQIHSLAPIMLGKKRIKDKQNVAFVHAWQIKQIEGVDFRPLHVLTDTQDI